MRKKFNYFPNYGDKEGNNSFTIFYAVSLDELDNNGIITCEDTEEDAIEVCTRLNEIIDKLTNIV